MEHALHLEDQVFKRMIIIITLTLSGQTHGYAIGIEIPVWIKWSPANGDYKYWAVGYERIGSNRSM